MSYPKVCFNCKGAGHLSVRLNDLSGKIKFMDNWHVVPCGTCKSKGYITQEDHDAYVKSWQLDELEEI